MCLLFSSILRSSLQHSSSGEGPSVLSLEKVTPGTTDRTLEADESASSHRIENKRITRRLPVSAGVQKVEYNRIAAKGKATNSPRL